MKRGSPVRLGLLLGAGLSLLAEPVQLERGLVSGGGGVAGSGRFSVTGTIGQPVADSAGGAGAALANRAGIWSQLLRWLNAAPTPAADVAERRAGQGAHVLASRLLANDRDGDWDPLQLVSVDGVSVNGGTVRRDGPWVVYLPPAAGNPTADDAFSYRVSDGFGASVVGTVQVRVAAAPAAAASPLAIRALAGPPAQVEVRFQGIAGRTYRLQTAPAVNGPWSDAGGPAASAAGVLTFTEAPPTDPRFYRLLEP